MMKRRPRAISGAAFALLFIGAGLTIYAAVLLIDDEKEDDAAVHDDPVPTAPPLPVESDDGVVDRTAEPQAVHDGPVPTVPALPATPDAVVPLRVLIPRIDVEASIIDLGTNDDGTLEVPDDYSQTGWYTGRSVPGDVGPSVVVGHIDDRTGPAVFFRLSELVTGDVVEVERSDGMVAQFRVTDAVDVAKTEFPTDAVYGATTEPTLRLITCGGSFDEDAGSYRGNLIVYAEYLGDRPATAPPASA